MRHADYRDVDVAQQALRNLSTGALSVHDAMYELDDASEGFYPLHDINDAWRSEVACLWNIGIDVQRDHPCVQKFIEDYTKALRDLVEVHLPF